MQEKLNKSDQKLKTISSILSVTDSVMAETENTDDCCFCMEIFNTEARHKCCLSSCGHQACYKCFWKILGATEGTEAECPMCKTLFSDQNIIKLY